MTATHDKPDQPLFGRPWIFIRGVPSMEFLPPEGPLEVAFAGRSNVGKSSLINALVGQAGLAQTMICEPPKAFSVRILSPVELARAENCEGAITEFEASYALAQRPNTLYNIARCQEQLNRYDLAIRYYEQYLSVARRPRPQLEREHVEDPGVDQRGAN